MRSMMRLMLAQSGGCGIVAATAWDDEFDCGAALDTAGSRFLGANAWTLLDTPLAPFTNPTQADGRLIITPRGSPTGTIQSMRGAQTLPVSGDWVFRASVDMVPVNYNEGIGLFLRESSTNKATYLFMGQDFSGAGGTLQYNAAVRITNGTRFGRTLITLVGGTYLSLVEVAKSGSNLTYRFSQNAGTSWTTITTRALTADFTTEPNEVGVVVQSPAPNNQTSTG
ncbi:MAG: hypothetical protein JWL95_1152, partial [Gemmatimonadetes bacterium]|nr:hypothetical protein [Gemmatimonadota bacterium]